MFVKQAQESELVSQIPELCVKQEIGVLVPRILDSH